MGLFGNLFKGVIEFKDLGKSISYVYVELDKIENNNFSYDDTIDRLEHLAYQSKKEILDPIEEFDWEISTKIALDNLPFQRVTLIFALNKTVGRLILLSDKHNISNQISNILR